MTGTIYQVNDEDRTCLECEYDGVFASKNNCNSFTIIDEIMFETF